MIDINGISLDSLPSSEPDELEYKSSLIDDTKLKREIQNAASAFWNSGGGALLAGVNDKGIVDGGILPVVGRQTRQDWIAHVISAVNPAASYTARLFDDSSNGNIVKGKCVLAVQFEPSAAFPHQSADYRYYIRAGAHTVPAPHFVVDALHAKRHFRNPRLVHITNMRYFSTESDFLHIELIAATDGAALNVQVDLNPRPTDTHGASLPITIPIIDRAHSFAFRCLVPKLPPFVSTIRVQYRDFANAQYSYEGPIDLSKCLSPWNRAGGELEEVIQEMREIKRVLERFGDGLR
jgi:hypothetical protein